MNLSPTTLKNKRFQTIALLVVIAMALLSLSYLVYSALLQDTPFSTKTSYIDAVGPIKAQEVAFSKLKPGGGLVVGHMYEHEVGGYLYQNYGVDGVKYCLPYFDHGCYNGFMLQIGSLNKMPTIEAALNSCSKLTLDALAACIHGAGHQALMLQNYDIQKALAQCDMFSQKYASSSLPSSPLYSPAKSTFNILLTTCTFGVFMENAQPGLMFGMANAAMQGKMDMKDIPNMMTKPSVLQSSDYPRWATKRSDPFFPCDDPTIDPRYLPGCWQMQIGSVSTLQPAAKTVAFCSTLQDQQQKYYCFVGLATGLTLTKELSAEETVSMCSTAPDIQSENTCIITVIQRDYLNGYGSDIPNQICAQIDEVGKTDCENMQKRMSIFTAYEDGE